MLGKVVMSYTHMFHHVRWFIHIWTIFGLNVRKYYIHGAYGIDIDGLYIEILNLVDCSATKDRHR